MLPSSKAEWMSLGFQYIKKVNDYNPPLLRICSQLDFYREEVYDAEMLEETLSIFRASNMTLQQQYQLKSSKNI